MDGRVQFIGKDSIRNKHFKKQNFQGTTRLEVVEGWMGGWMDG